MHIKSINSYDDFQTEINSKQNIIVNISATWCKPCVALKPSLEKYIKVINENDFIYLKIDHSIYETDDRFDMYFKMKKIPYFIFIEMLVTQNGFNLLMKM
jgi:thiol-disulfide isomerase/thioredoxin